MMELLAFSLGVVVASFMPEAFRSWVRGAAGKARGVVLGSRPAQTFATGIFAKSPIGNAEITSEQPDIQPDMKLGEFSQTPPKPPITAGKVLSNILDFVAGLARHWKLIACIVLVVVIWSAAHSIWRFASCPLGKPGLLWCVGQSNETAAIENERANTRVAELEASVAALSAQLAENSANDHRRVDRIVSNANEELDYAVEADDFDGAYSIYRRAYDSVWNDLAPASEPDPAANGPDTVRSAPSSPV